MIETLSLQSLLQRTLSDTLSLSESVIGNVYKQCDDNYEPNVALSIRDITTLFYPFTSPIFSVDLRNPEFGDADSTNTNSLYRKTRGGDIKVIGSVRKH